MIEAPRIKLRKESEIIETIKNMYLAGVDVEDFTVYVHDENIRLFSGPYNHIFQTMFGDLPVEFIEELDNDEFVILPNNKPVGIKLDSNLIVLQVPYECKDCECNKCDSNECSVMKPKSKFYKSFDETIMSFSWLESQTYMLPDD